MIKQSIHYFLISIITISSAFSYASECSDVTNTINSDINRYADAILEKHLPWLSLFWIQQKLGHGQIKKAGNDTLVFKWICPEENGSYLTVYTNQNRIPIKMEGIYSSEEGSGIFTTTFGRDLPIRVTPSIEQEYSDILKSYNDHFKTAFQSEDQINSDMAKKIKKYYSDLRSCKPGTHNYFIPHLANWIFPTSIIHGQQQGYCNVETSYNLPKVGNIFIKCRYQPETLQQYTDKEADYALQSVSSFVSQSVAELQKDEKQQCQIFTNGQLAKN